MPIKRFDWPGHVLVLFAAIAIWLSDAPRRSAASWYNDVAAYNRSVTRFLTDNRDDLGDGPIAVFGVAGLSPWSYTNGAYLSQSLGKNANWLVFVPREDTFYKFGTATGAFYKFGALPGATVSVFPEREACSKLRGQPATYLVFDERGHGNVAPSCEAALERVQVAASVAAWGPKSVTESEASAGFNMYFTGTGLLPWVGVMIAGKPLPMTYAAAGKLMTTSIPPRSAHESEIRFSIVSRERTVLNGAVEVK